MRLLWITLLALTLASCIQMTTRSGDCNTASGDVTWVFYNEMPLNSSWAKCIYCGSNVSEENLYDFVHSHYSNYPEDRGYLLEALEQQRAEADSLGEDINESLSPCFYTYTWNGFDTDTQTGCEQDTCSDNPSIHDMVGRGHGAWSVARGVLGIHYD